MPSAWSGSAVTGPTHTADAVSPERGEEFVPYAPLLRPENSEAAAGALVKVTASRVRERVASRSRSEWADVLGASSEMGRRRPRCCRGERLDEAGEGLAVELEGDPAACHAFAEEPVEDLGHGDLEEGDQDSVSPAARTAPLTLGPRARSSTSRRTRRSSSPYPQPSAASTQPRKPIAVVATTTSGAWPMSSLVAARSSVSSASGTIRRAGPWTTAAPRRRSSAISSSARRAAVTPTVKPARGPCSCSSMGPEPDGDA
ncbi:hypothetical protein STANM309S_02110 [Streptomyces tanashiensis]